MDDKNFGKILNEVAELERDHASKIVSTFDYLFRDRI